MNKLIRNTLAVAALAVASFGAQQASANTVCAGCTYDGAGDYLGSLNPTTFDNSSFTHNAIANGAFTDTWLFQINPGGQAAVNAIFLPVGGVTLYDITLYAVTSTCAVPTIDSPCASTLGAVKAVNSSAIPFVVQTAQDLAAGFYAFVITGTSQNNPNPGIPSNLYSGNINVQVAEPASLAMLGFGLLGVAAARRRRKAA